jgi:hypothetical protein
MEFYCISVGSKPRGFLAKLCVGTFELTVAITEVVFVDIFSGK